MPFFKKRIPALLGPDNRTLKLSTAAPGGCNERSLKLHRNSDYEIRLRWLATREGEDMDWYCWEAKVDGLPTQATYESYDGTRLPEVAEFFPVANSWIVDNREGLLTSHVHMNAEEGGNVAGGTVAYLRKVDLKEVEGTNVDGELKIRGNVALDGVFDRISISRDVAGSDVELDGMAYSGGNFAFTLDQNEDILRVDSLGRILSPDSFDLKVSLEIGGNVIATVDLPVEISTEQTSGSDTYSYWYGDLNSGGAALFRVFFPMRLDETYVSVKYSNLVHKGRTNYLYQSYFESNFAGAGPGWGEPTMNVGHRYVGPEQEYPIGMIVPSAIVGPNTQPFEARTNKWVDEDYMTDLSHGEGLVNLTFSNMIGPVPWIPPLDQTVESPDQGL